MEGLLVTAATAETISSNARIPHTTDPDGLRQGFLSTVRRAEAHLLDLQKPDGHWCAELEGDTILESEYILLMAFLGREGEEDCQRAARSMEDQALSSGGWSIYPGGPAEISATVKAYFALKLLGRDIQSPLMSRAREVVLRQGGARRSNSFTRFYLALLGQFPYKSCPSVPPELALIPKWFPVHLGEMSSWTRTIVVPLSIVSACKPVRKLPESRGIRELFLDDPFSPAWPATPTPQLFSWTNFFLGIDWLLKKGEPFLGPIRRMALNSSLAWMRARFVDSDGLGAIFPPMIYTVIALRCMGVPDDSPEMAWALKQIDDLKVRDRHRVWLQPCLSPVWDTALSLNALAECGHRADGLAVASANEWLAEREVRQKGDWNDRIPGMEPGGWFFEYRNAFYPDTDDTAMVLMAFARTCSTDGADQRTSIRRAIRWLLSMQNSDGGWAAFDRDIVREFLTKVPFADHNAMLDPSCPDITARVLESLAEFGMRLGDPVCDKGVAFLRRTQEASGAWIGRWGVNYLYGTWQVLVGLEKIGVDQADPMVQRAAEWLRSVQQTCGGWGETCGSYDDPALAGCGEPTASQTAWAVMGLLAAGDRGPSVLKGIQWLVDRQLPSGGWEEEPFTGTGFPKVFYLKYHYYRIYFPLMALARAARLGFSPN